MPHQSAIASVRVSTTQRRRTTRLLLSLGLLGGSLGGCTTNPITYFAEGVQVVCTPGAEAEDSLPDIICVWKSIEGGLTDEVVSAACSQEHNKFFGADSTAADFASAYIINHDGQNQTCLTETVGEYEAHPFPVKEIGGAGAEPNPNSNAIFCQPNTEIEITDGDGSYKALSYTTPCIESSATSEERLEACEQSCLDWAEQYEDDGYDEFSVGPDNGDCSPENFLEPWIVYRPYCVAEQMEGAALPSIGWLAFDDPSNSIGVELSGSVIYDDSQCTSTDPCEPAMLVRLQSDRVVLDYYDLTGSSHPVVLSGVQLQTLQPVQTHTNAASGALEIESMELELAADAVFVDRVAYGPMSTREFTDVVSVASEPTGQLVLRGDVHVPTLDASVSISITIDPPSVTGTLVD